MTDSNNKPPFKKGIHKGGGHIRNSAYLNTLQRSELIKLAMEERLRGISTDEIKATLIATSPVEIPDSYAASLVAASLKLLEDSVNTNIAEAVLIHVGFYEKIYAYFHDIEHVQGQNKAMKQNERVLGLGEQKKVKIDKKTVINASLPEVKYKVRPEDQDEFDELMKIALS